MHKPVFLLILLLIPIVALATAELEGPGSLPVEINATGQTAYKSGIATARDNVAIHYGDTDIYSDYAQYDSAKHTLFLRGHVRIYRGIALYLSESAVYNLDTKAIQAGDMRSSTYPYLIAGHNVVSTSDTQYNIKNGALSTDDAEDPDFQLKAQSVRIYENDRVIMRNVTLYIGKIPVFWWPYLYQSLDQSFSYAIAPAYLSSWGPSLLGRLTFPIGDNISATVKLDYRSRRGEALGFDADADYGYKDMSHAKISTYFLQDQNPELNRTSLPRGDIPTGRYRFSIQDHTRISDDIELTTDITKLSDAFLLQDFFPAEFINNPNPDNNIAITQTHPDYTLTAYMRYQLNPFFETTERLPEIDLDVKRYNPWGGPIFYESETSVANLERNFETGSAFEDYGVFRVDTFHQITFPTTLFGWLSVVPRLGFRETYYSETRDLGNTLFPLTTDPLAPTYPLPVPVTGVTPLELSGPSWRSVINGGVESSFKVSRTWDNVQSRFLGLDGLMHVIQPFADFSWVSNQGTDPLTILQFDRFQPSTKLPPLEFPEFTSIDSIDNWTIARLGVHNRLLTRRDDATTPWITLDTYFDFNIDNPYDHTPYSNLFNNLLITPVPWATFEIDSQVPALDKGFTEVDTSIRFQPTSTTSLTLGHRYLNNNPFFLNSSLFTVGAYYRINDNWGLSAYEQYEGTTKLLEQQRYSVYRDLTSWVASFGAIITDNNGVKEYGVLLTFTLKAFPKLNFDLNFDPAGTNQTQQ